MSGARGGTDMQRRIARSIAVLVALLGPAAPAAAQCDGDADKNGFVNFSDYAAVRGKFGTGCTGEPHCGNGTIDAGEACDVEALGGATCATEGFAGGRLRCRALCVFDTTGCYASRFVDNADGTVSDNETGLAWEKKLRSDATVDPDNLQDADNVYPWAGTCSVASVKRCQPDAPSSAACSAGVDGNPVSCAECGVGEGTCTVGAPGITIWQWLGELNAASFAGYGDWRIPTHAELESLVNLEASSPATFTAFHGTSCGAACADLADPECACTRVATYWTASIRLFDPAWAWSFDFANGNLSQIPMTDQRLVRAVRGGP